MSLETKAGESLLCSLINYLLQVLALTSSVLTPYYEFLEQMLTVTAH
jgi:hypothetical protein